MAVSGAWKNRQPQFAGARKWGTGWNPVHSIDTGDAGRNIAPGTPVAAGPIPIGLTDTMLPELGYTDEDSASVLYGYGPNTGTSDRPPWGDEEDTRGVTPDFPSWGSRASGISGGADVRALKHGNRANFTAKQSPNETVSEGWQNKRHGEVADAVVSAPSQYEMNTSMTQRDKTRAGSQTSGRASEYNAPIRSRIPGQRLKFFSGGERHYDMQPREQEPVIRHWWARTAGTGYREWMAPNEMYVSEPLQRTPPPNAYQGDTIGDPDEPDTVGYGFVGEDVIPYV